MRNEVIVVDIILPSALTVLGDVYASGLLNNVLTKSPSYRQVPTFVLTYTYLNTYNHNIC